MDAPSAKERVTNISKNDEKREDCFTIVPDAFRFFINTASTLDGTIWGRFMAIGPYGVSPFLTRSIHALYPALGLAEKPRMGV